MKKHISFIPMDSVLAKWLCDKLKSDPPDSKYADYLLAGLYDFLAGQSSTLMLGAFGTIEDGGDDGIYAGALAIYPKSRKVLLNDSDISLTPKEFDILYFLIKHRGEVFTKEQIYQAVWAEDFLLADSNIMAFIRKLRKKIEPNPDSPEYILTIWGVGYKFNDRL